MIVAIGWQKDPIRMISVVHLDASNLINLPVGGLSFELLPVLIKNSPIKVPEIYSVP
jgi:hypothetical protein